MNIHQLEAAMGRPPKYMDDPKSRRRFIEHLEAWEQVRDLCTIEQYFAALPEGENLCSSALFATLKRYGLSLPTNRNLPREQILEEQRADKTPADVVAWRNDIRVSTLRTWARKYKLPLKGNTPAGRREWWEQHFLAMDMDDPYHYFKRKRLPAHIAIPMWHAINVPDEYMAWIKHEPDERAVYDGTVDRLGELITTWSEQEYLNRFAALTPDYSDEPETFLGHRATVHPVIWEDIE